MMKRRIVINMITPEITPSRLAVISINERTRVLVSINWKYSIIVPYKAERMIILQKNKDLCGCIAQSSKNENTE